MGVNALGTSASDGSFDSATHHITRVGGWQVSMAKNPACLEAEKIGEENIWIFDRLSQLLEADPNLDVAFAHRVLEVMLVESPWVKDGLADGANVRQEFDRVADKLRQQDEVVARMNDGKPLIDQSQIPTSLEEIRDEDNYILSYLSGVSDNRMNHDPRGHARAFRHLLRAKDANRDALKVPEKILEWTEALFGTKFVEERLHKLMRKEETIPKLINQDWANNNAAAIEAVRRQILSNDPNAFALEDAIAEGKPYKGVVWEYDTRFSGRLVGSYKFANPWLGEITANRIELASAGIMRIWVMNHDYWFDTTEFEANQPVDQTDPHADTATRNVHIYNYDTKTFERVPQTNSLHLENVQGLSRILAVGSHLSIQIAPDCTDHSMVLKAIDDWLKPLDI